MLEHSLIKPSNNSPLQGRPRETNPLRITGSADSQRLSQFISLERIPKLSQVDHKRELIDDKTAVGAGAMVGGTVGWWAMCTIILVGGVGTLVVIVPMLGLLLGAVLGRYYPRISQA